MKLPPFSLHLPHKPKVTIILISFALTLLLSLNVLLHQQNSSLRQSLTVSNDKLTAFTEKLQSTESELESLKSQDQLKINQDLKQEIKNIKDTYSTAVSSYEKLLSLKETGQKTTELDSLFASSLSLLSQSNYTSASATLKSLAEKISAQQKQLVSSSPLSSPNIPQNNTPPDSGYRQQKVATPQGTFTVDIVAADLNSTRVIIDTASDSDCANNCPVLPLKDYISRNQAFAGINGSYFCPAEYPSCSGKTNSFDTLLMNKNKRYFNSDNNVYSTVPAVIFSGNSARFVSQSLEWGRDTGVDAVIANYPLLTKDNQIVIGSSSDSKLTNRGNRSFVGTTGSTVYIGVVRSVTITESAEVIHTLGIQNSINLDNGGSTALWCNGYKFGPGRNLPNSLLLVRK